MTTETEVLIRSVEITAEVVGAAFLGAIIWGMKKMIMTIVDNNYAIVRLTSQIEDLTASIAPLPRMQLDLHEAHKKIRDLEKRNNGL